MLLLQQSSALFLSYLCRLLLRFLTQMDFKTYSADPRYISFSQKLRTVHHIALSPYNCYERISSIIERFAAADPSLFERVLRNKLRVPRPVLPEKSYHMPAR